MSYEQFVIKSCRKTPRSMAEAFSQPEWCCPITKPKESDFDGFGAFLSGLAFVAIFAYGLWLTMGRY